MKNNKSIKKIILYALIGILALVLAGGGTAYAVKAIAESKSIGLDNAVASAIADSGLKEDEITITKAKLTLDSGKFIYDVEFTANGIEYDYEIDAHSGKILEHDIDKADIRPGKKPAETSSVPTSSEAEPSSVSKPANDEKNTVDSEPSKKEPSTSKKAENSTNDKKPSENKTTDPKERISKEDALAIALKAAKLNKSQISYSYSKLERDDGRYVYDVYFTAAENDSYYKEYDYEIDAVSGKVLDFDVDRERITTFWADSSTTQKPSPSTTKPKETSTKANENSNGVSSKYIGVDAAKSAALKHAGLSAKDVTFTKAKLERDDGVYEYDIEFFSGRIEYEYEINAVSGKIISHDKDFD